MSEYELLREYELAKKKCEDFGKSLTRISKLHQIAKNSNNKEEVIKTQEIIENLLKKIEKIKEELTVL